MPTKLTRERSAVAVQTEGQGSQKTVSLVGEAVNSDEVLTSSAIDLSRSADAEFAAHAGERATGDVTETAKKSVAHTKKNVKPLKADSVATLPQDSQVQAANPNSPIQETKALWPLLPEKAAPRLNFEKQGDRSLMPDQIASKPHQLHQEDLLDATTTVTEGETGRAPGQLIALGDKKIFRIVGDPVIDAMEARVRERKEKERVRKDKDERRQAEQRRIAEEARAAEEKEKARVHAEELESKRLEVERNREKIRLMEEERMQRLNKGKLKADMQIITGVKSTVDKYEEARQRDKMVEEAALNEHIAASKLAAKKRRGSKLKKDIEEHERATVEREKVESELRRQREQEGRERLRAQMEALESTVTGVSSSTHVLSNAAGEEGLSKALVKIRQGEEDKRRQAAEPKVTPRTAQVSAPKPFQTKVFVPPPKQTVVKSPRSPKTSGTSQSGSISDVKESKAGKVVPAPLGPKQSPPKGLKLPEKETVAPIPASPPSAKGKAAPKQPPTAAAPKQSPASAPAKVKSVPKQLTLKTSSNMATPSPPAASPPKARVLPKQPPTTAPAKAKSAPKQVASAPAVSSSPVKPKDSPASGSPQSKRYSQITSTVNPPAKVTPATSEQTDESEKSARSVQTVDETKEESSNVPQATRVDDRTPSPADEEGKVRDDLGGPNPERGVDLADADPQGKIDNDGSRSEGGDVTKRDDDAESLRATGVEEDAETDSHEESQEDGNAGRFGEESRQEDEVDEL